MTNTHYEIRLSGKDVTLTASSSADADLHILEEGLEGFGITALSVETKAYAGLPGGHPVSRRFGERYLAIHAEVNAASPEEEHAIRRRIIRLMNPLSEIEMRIRIHGVSRLITVIPHDTPKLAKDTLFSPLQVSLTFIAPDPFYRDAEELSFSFRQTVPLMAFPLNFMEETGMTTGYLRSTDTTEVYNPGDAACGMTAVLTADGGMVENPVLACGDRYIRLLTVLQDGDTAEIDTRPRRKNVLLNGERHFVFDRTSDFFLLEPGENKITVSADSGGEFLSVSLYCTPLYFGL